MATISIWRGYRHWNWDEENDYETVTYADAEEIGAVRFENEEADIQYRIIQYRIIQWDEGIVIFYVKREGHYCEAEIFEYPDLEAAARDYAFILRKAGVIQ
jgi:hypothetical protein